LHVKSQRIIIIAVFFLSMNLFPGGLNMNKKLANLPKYKNTFMSICRLCPVVIIFLGIMSIVSCGGGGGHSDNNNNNGTTNATITGTVAGTTVVAMDANDNEIDRQAATGSPKTFTLTVPTGDGYRFFLIENEGTANERIYPLYYGMDNVFDISSGVTIDLGYVNISSGVAVPENNPVNMNGVSSSSGNASVPASLAGNAFTTADLQGTWKIHALTKGASIGNGIGWTYGTLDLDNSGNYTLSTASSDEQYADGSGDNGFTAGPSGKVATTVIPNFNGIISHDKNLIIATSDNKAGNYMLEIFQKSGDITYNSNDLEGIWNVHILRTGNSIGAGIGWGYGTISLDSSGNTVAESITRSDSSEMPSLGTLAIGTDGIITDINFTHFNGFLSADKALITATADDGNGGYQLMIFQKTGSVTFALSDLEGAWNGHALVVDDTAEDPVGWIYETYVINTNGYISNISQKESNNNADVITSLLGPVAISSDGAVTSNFVDNFSDNFNGSMSVNKNLMVTTYDDDIGSHILISIK
jgi:hypothetical protein